MVIGPSQYVNFFSSYSCNATAQMLHRKSHICSGMQLQSNLAAFLFNYPFAVLFMIPDKPFPSQVSLLAGVRASVGSHGLAPCALPAPRAPLVAAVPPSSCPQSGWVQWLFDMSAGPHRPLPSSPSQSLPEALVAPVL